MKTKSEHSTGKANDNHWTSQKTSKRQRVATPLPVGLFLLLIGYVLSAFPPGVLAVTLPGSQITLTNTDGSIIITNLDSTVYISAPPTTLSESVVTNTQASVSFGSGTFAGPLSASTFAGDASGITNVGLASLSRETTNAFSVLSQQTNFFLGYMGDIHSANGNAGIFSLTVSNYAQTVLSNSLVWARTNYNPKLRAFLSAGDIVQGAGETGEAIVSNYVFMTNQLWPLVDSGVPFISCAGNHEDASFDSYFGPLFVASGCLAATNAVWGFRECLFLQTNYGVKIAYITTQWNATNQTSWVQSCLTNHPDHVGIILAHKGLTSHGDREFCSDPEQNGTVAGLDKLILDQVPNPLIIISGHNRDAFNCAFNIFGNQNGSKQTWIYWNAQLNTNTGANIFKEMQWQPLNNLVSTRTFDTEAMRYMQNGEPAAPGSQTSNGYWLNFSFPISERSSAGPQSANLDGLRIRRQSVAQGIGNWDRNLSTNALLDVWQSFTSYRQLGNIFDNYGMPIDLFGWARTYDGTFVLRYASNHWGNLHSGSDFITITPGVPVIGMTASNSLVAQFADSAGNATKLGGIAASNYLTKLEATAVLNTNGYRLFAAGSVLANGYYMWSGFSYTNATVNSRYISNYAGLWHNVLNGNSRYTKTNLWDMNELWVLDTGPAPAPAGAFEIALVQTPHVVATNAQFFDSMAVGANPDLRLNGFFADTNLVRIVIPFNLGLNAATTNLATVTNANSWSFGGPLLVTAPQTNTAGIVATNIITDTLTIGTGIINGGAPAPSQNVFIMTNSSTGAGVTFYITNGLIMKVQ